MCLRAVLAKIVVFAQTLLVMPSPNRRVLLILATVSTLLVTALPGAALSAQGDARVAKALERPHSQRRVIVGFEPGTSRVKQRRGVSATAGVASVAQVSPIATDTVVVQLEPGQSVADAMKDISSQPGVAYVEPDYRVRAADTSNDPSYTSGGLWGMYGDGTSPSNPYGSAAGEAWQQGYVGDTNVYVGIVDEGVMTTHPDLAANIWTNPWEPVNGIDDDRNGYVDDVNGWDFIDETPSVYDGPNDDHGTHVAGTIGARGGNGIGVAGVNWKVTLISAKFLGDDFGYTSDAIEALDYITRLKTLHGLNIVATNNSWSGGGYSQGLLDAIDRAGDAGILFVAAAGNDGSDIDARGSLPVYPAAYRCNDGGSRGWDCIISVANIQANGSLNATSNRGATSVDLGAPGTAIESTVPPGDGYAKYSGTSMATPHVTGAVALCASIDPSRSAKQIRDRIMSSAMPTGSLARVTVTGGRLDIGDLVSRCEAVDPPATTETVYVDDLDPGFRRFGSGWRGAAVGYADHLYWVPTRKGSRSAYGSWKPSLPDAGSYSVMARIPVQYATSRKAAYKIRTADGWVTRVRNQYKRQGSWVSLGVHRLTRTPIVQLANLTGEPTSWGRHLAFDAIRFVPVSK